MTFLGMVTFLEMAAIIGMMTNDHPKDGGHPLDRLNDFDPFWEVDFPRDGDRSKNGDHHRFQLEIRLSESVFQFQILSNWCWVVVGGGWCLF